VRAAANKHDMETRSNSTTVLSIALGALVVLLAGCTTAHARASRAADGLEHSVEVFTARACYEPNPACFAARGFAEQTHEFRQTLDTAGDAEVVSAFKRVWRGYQTLRGEIYRSDDRQFRPDLKPITQAFIDVQRTVRNRYSYADPALYANGAYFFDPYYN
jgi:hypothetical protein